MAGSLAPIPFLQFVDAQGRPRVGAQLFQYLTETQDKEATYAQRDLDPLSENPNPMITNELGIAGDSNGDPLPIYFDPTKIYTLWLADEDESDPPATSIMVADDLVAPGVGVVTAVVGFAGNPNGSVAGTAATPGLVNADMIFDTVGNILYICTTSGSATTAVWTNVTSAISGAVSFTGVISPTAIGTQQDDYDPTDLSTAATIRLNPSADGVDITGLAGGSAGREILLVNTHASNRINLKTQDTDSDAANRFLLPNSLDVPLLGNYSCLIRYDSVSARWRLVSPPLSLELGSAQFVKNCQFAISVGSNALTIAVKTDRGADPSPADPVVVSFRDPTVTVGGYSLVTITAALSVVVPQGGTLGFGNAEANLIHFGFINNAGVAELAVSQDGAIWQEDRLISSTTVGTGSDSKSVIYSTTGRASVGCRMCGVALITTGATAGDWSNAPTRVTPVSSYPAEPYKNTTKGWGKLDGATAVVQDGFNIASISDVNTGRATVTLAVTMRNALFAATATAQEAEGTGRHCQVNNGTPPTTTTLSLNAISSAGANTDPVFYHYAING